MHRGFWRWVMAVVVVGITACSGGSQKDAPTGESGFKGQYGVYYLVSLSRPSGGTIRSTDGQLDCGTLGGAANACGPARFDWNVTASLTATPDTGKVFQSWAGDCLGSNPNGCFLSTVNNGADKYVAAFFNTAAQLGHGNILSPTDHGPLFLDFLAGKPNTPQCNTCHGPGYGGVSIAPSCNACHLSAGWANWQQNCSFCHGVRDATTKAGYDVSIHPEWAAPPDDVAGRLSGTNGAATGAHAAHVKTPVVRAPLPCAECHIVPSVVLHAPNPSPPPFGPLASANGAAPTWNGTTLTCASTYCHGNFTYGNVAGNTATPSWTGGSLGCTGCHGMPPTGHMNVSGAPSPSSCRTCHPDTVLVDGTIDVAGGKHIDGKASVSGGACDACHGFPPQDAAHRAHFGLTAAEGTSGYGDLSILETRFPTASPATAPDRYAFGCGNCHPSDFALHMNGTTNVDLSRPGTASLKERNDAGASYDLATGTCSGVYCHSGGQASPSFRTSPAWTSVTGIGCNGCHDNPPRYASGGAGTPTANSHLGLADDGWEYGHFLGLPGPHHGSRHGGGASSDPTRDATPMTCESCHFDTTDPAGRGPSGFYWLNTDGDYALPGGDPARVTSGEQAALQCTHCHTPGSPTAPTRSGGVLPLRHVNGSRDVVFDPRSADPLLQWVAPPNDPQRPSWMTWSSQNSWWDRTMVSWRGSTVQFDLGASGYDAPTKTCTNVACHLAQGNTKYAGSTPRTVFEPLPWGLPWYYVGIDPATGRNSCTKCHRT